MICRDERASRVIGWKSKTSTSFRTLLRRILSITGWMEQWRLVSVSYVALILRALFDGLQPLLTGLIFNTIGANASPHGSGGGSGGDGGGGSGGDDSGGDGSGRGAILVGLICAVSPFNGCNGGGGGGGGDYNSQGATAGIGVEGASLLSPSSASSSSSPSALLKSLILALFVAAACRAALSSLHTYCSIRVQELAVLSLRSRLVRHLLLQEQQWFDDLRAGEAASRTDPHSVADFLNRVLPNFLADAVKLVVVMSFLAAISPIMTITYICMLPATVYLSREVVEKPMTRYRRMAKQHQVCAIRSTDHNPPLLTIHHTLS